MSERSVVTNRLLERPTDRWGHCEPMQTHSECSERTPQKNNIVIFKNKSHLCKNMFNFALLLFKYDFETQSIKKRKLSVVSDCHYVWHLGDLFEFNSRQTSAQKTCFSCRWTPISQSHALIIHSSLYEFLSNRHSLYCMYRSDFDMSFEPLKEQ